MAKRLLQKIIVCNIKNEWRMIKRLRELFIENRSIGES